MLFFNTVEKFLAVGVQKFGPHLTDFKLGRQVHFVVSLQYKSVTTWVTVQTKHTTFLNYILFIFSVKSSVGSTKGISSCKSSINLKMS